MNNLQTKGSFNLTFLIFLQTFFLGWATYSLKLVSLLKLLDELSFKAYPPLMLIQGFSLYFCMRLFSKIAAKSADRFYLLTLLISLFIVYVGIAPYIKTVLPFKTDWVYACVIFLFSSISLLGIEISLKTLISGRISVLQSPQISGQLAFTQELGIITGATLSLIINKYFSNFFTLYAILPILITIGLFLIMKKGDIANNNSIKSENNEEELKIFTKEEIKKRTSFLPYFIALITIVMILKNIQGFAMIIGIKEWKESSTLDLKDIFSYLSIGQTLFILGVLSTSLFSSKVSTSWVRGFDILFKVQAVSMVLLSLFAPPFLLIGTGALRKIVHRGYFNKSSTMLLSTIPKKMRFMVQSSSQRIGNSVSFIFLGLLSYLSINQWIPYNAVWFICGLFAIAGLLLRKKLLTKLNSFQINTITKFHKKYTTIYDAVNSCYSLANKEASPHYDALSLLLFWQPKPMLTKAVIYSLGEMNNEKNVQIIFKSFHKFPREDIQSLAIKSLKNYQSKEVDTFIKNALTGILDNDLPLGQLRIHLCLEIYAYHPKMTFKVIREYMLIYKNNILASLKLIELLGERAKITKDKELFNLLYKFFHRKYEKITRVRVSQYLYTVRKYRTEVRDFIDSLKDSSAIDDQSSLAFLSGALKLKENLPMIKKFSSEKKSQNIIYLIALIQLGDQRAYNYLLIFINQLTKEAAINILKRIHIALSAQQKYSLYLELLQNHQGEVELFLEMLNLTDKDYDADRQTIFNEANRLNIPLSDDFALFEKVKKTPTKSA